MAAEPIRSCVNNQLTRFRLLHPFLRVPAFQIAESDREGTGTISFETFQAVMAEKMQKRDPKEEAEKAFRLFDDDETSTISLKNLRRVAKELGENMTDDELQEVIDFCDKDGRGEIQKDDFCSTLLEAQSRQHEVGVDDLEVYGI